MSPLSVVGDVRLEIEGRAEETLHAFSVLFLHRDFRCRRAIAIPPGYYGDASLSLSDPVLQDAHPELQWLIAELNEMVHKDFNWD